ncbi:hypothetical protein PRIPAC_82187, partial [Pristionchus pacificus]
GMPVKGSSRQIDRDCLVCGQNTRIAHLGIDACRACAVFYRRARRGQDLVCRSTTGGCPRGKTLNCKRCRLDHIEKLVNQSGALPELATASSSAEQIEKDDSNSPSEDSGESSNPAASSSRIPQITDLPIIDRLKTHYRTMCWARLMGETQSRSEPPHPLEISLETGPFLPATIGSLAVANRILLTALLEFASSVFPEFGQLEKKEKWDIVVNNFYRVRLLEGCYRAGIIYPDDMNKKFAGYTTWMSIDNIEYFYSDAKGDKAKAVEHIQHSTIRLPDVRKAREVIQRVNPCLEEFLVVLCIMFWSLGEMTVRDEITRIGETYTEAILKELHAFYREHMKIDDYATRLGQLMMFIPMFDRSKDMKEHFEVLHLLGVLPADNFTYLLQKSN